MSKTANTFYSTKTENFPAPVAFVNADSTNWKDIFTAGADGAIVKGIGALSTDTGAVNMLIGILPSGGSVAAIGGFTITGTATFQNPTDVLKKASIPCAKYDNNGNMVLQLPAACKLQAMAVAAVASNKTLTISVQGEDF